MLVSVTIVKNVPLSAQRQFGALLKFELNFSVVAKGVDVGATAMFAGLNPE
jgi:hypothetical protein